MRTFPSHFMAMLLPFLGYALCSQAADDFREFQSARRIPAKNYCDQPYLVVMKSGEWLCTMTTGPGKESEPGQHVVGVISSDKGKTWSEPIDIEPSGGPEASWVIPFVTPGGRIYAFYDYNQDRVNKLGDKTIKATIGGWYVYKYSDDNGRTWSKERYRLPMPVTALDQGNDWAGKFQLFWGIDKPEIVGEEVLFAFTRMGKFPHSEGEGWVYASDNLLTEKDPAKIRWTLRPEGGKGFRKDEMGSIQEEHNVVSLADNSLYCIFRTAQGYPGESYSRDGGRTWSEPEYAVYEPGGRKIKTPTACARVFRTENGKYLLWFHNTSSQQKGADVPVTGRNLGWFSAGKEKDGMIHWSQPELINYNSNRRRGCSYPDLIEVDGEYYLSSTNKKDARIQHLDKTLIEGLWGQSENREPATKGMVLSLEGKDLTAGAETKMPPLPDLEAGGGFTVDLCVQLKSGKAGEVVIDSRDNTGRGIAVVTTENGGLQFEMNDGKTRAQWETDSGLLSVGKKHRVAFVVDGGPKMISVIVDGVLADGGGERPFGYGRFFAQENEKLELVGQEMKSVSSEALLRIGSSADVEISRLRIYDRYLRTSEVVGNHRATDA